MNTIKLILLSVFIVGFSLHSNADGEKKNNETASYNTMFYNEISSQLHYPQSAIDLRLEGFVVVSFTINSSGNIDILEMNSNDPILMEAAKSSLSTIQLCSHASGKVYNMKFNYSLI
jgi:hypothetical protein